jgi:hypothetical protein
LAGTKLFKPSLQQQIFFYHFFFFVLIQLPNPTMCIRVIEKWAVCGCIYYTHAVDACPAYGQHGVSDKVIHVGYACPKHK